MQSYPTLIAVADEHSARVFVRLEPHGPLSEKLDYTETADLRAHGDPLPSALVRTGGRPRIKPRAERLREELDIFLRHVGSRIDEAVKAEHARSLAIVAPPFVLGKIRDYVSHWTREKLVCESCADLVNQTQSGIDAEIRRMRM